jgi:hypothetical protein
VSTSGPPPTRPGRLRSWYGAGPLHFAAMAACFAVAGYVLPRIIGARNPGQIALWFIGALVLHDFVLFPAYAALDRLGGWLATRSRSVPVPWINHVRAPLVLSGLVLLVWAPLVLRLRPEPYESASGLSPSPYLGRWLVVTALLWGGSAVVYGARVVRERRRSA